MYRILLIVVTVIVIGLAIGYGLRSSHKTSAAVTALLPRETVAFVHVPDFESTVDQWHHSDIYELYREPAVQDFLRKPLSRVPKAEGASQTRREIEQLNPKDAFFALTSAEDDNPKVVAGFRFSGSEDDAEKIIGGWRAETHGQQQGRGDTGNARIPAAQDSGLPDRIHRDLHGLFRPLVSQRK